MALLKDFTDLSGNGYSPAYWRAVQINISAIDQNIRLVFYAYKDAEAFQAGKQPLPGGVKVYQIAGAEFAGLAMSAPVGASLYDALAHAAESHALGKLDTDGKSFFDGANQV